MFIPPKYHRRSFCQQPTIEQVNAPILSKSSRRRGGAHGLQNENQRSPPEMRIGDKPTPNCLPSWQSRAAALLSGRMAAPQRHNPPADPLGRFAWPVQAWFRAAFGRPTEAHARGWPPICDGQSTLLLAPTGSGKTLAAFLAGIDRLMFAAAPPKMERCRLLYISLPRVSARTPRGPCFCRAALPVIVRRSGRSANGRRTCWRWPRNTTRSRSFWKRIANVCRTFLICPAWLIC
jgi:hypothetical protein